MVSEQLGGSHDLVGLYAARRLARPARPEVQPNRDRSAPALHHFGRQPVAPRRSGLARRVVAPALVASAAVAAGVHGAAAAVTHQVEPGETLTVIAEQYGLSVDDLARTNGLADPDLIEAGANLVIEPDAVASPTGRTHTVASGETLSRIADQYGLTVESLVTANGLASPDLIATGTSLAIPSIAPNATQPAQARSEAGSPQLHLVVEGETLAEIADRYGVDSDAIARLNGITDPNLVQAGQLLRIPGTAAAEQGDRVSLRGMPILRQSLPLSCESAALSMATAYWGDQVSEWVFIENMPYDANPHYGFRGEMTGPFGGTDDYGVYAEPLVPLLNRYGFGGDVFYADGNADLLKQQIDQGHPVVVWMTNMASVQQPFDGWSGGERFTLVPQQHVVVVYGYDASGVYVADPGDGAYRQFGWDDFMRSWGYFDGMALAVYPA